MPGWRLRGRAKRRLMDVVTQDTRKGEERRRGCRGQDEMIGCGEPFREQPKEEERSFLKKNLQKLSNLFSVIYH